MDDLLEVLTNPYLLSLIIILTLFSTAFVWIGLKQKSLWKVLLGTGLGIPTLSITDWQCWAIGTALCLLALWLRSKLEAV